MKIKLSYLILFLCIDLFANAQTPAIKEIKKKQSDPVFSFGFGANLSSVNVFRNYKENPYNLGLNTRLAYNFNDNIRFVAEYTRTKKFDLNPTWLNIKSQSFVISTNAVGYIKDQDVMIYTISGLCIQSWNGYYTGLQDFSTAQFYYTDNTYIRNRNICLDLGIGFERPFPGFNLYGDFRYRFANIDNRFGITDANYNLGIKFPIIVKQKGLNKKHPKKKRKLFKGSDKYHWF